ncbi:MAG: type II toxin-antitoxin system RelB/DinJ family antitoxin [Atopobiaceae bacterium]|nr:type II toxin-antitoxin system RelB/DinJ family antitoxin [Atopobiaceae bacterium]
MAEQMTPIVAKVSPAEKERFFEATELIGTTPSNAIRMFVSAFNREGTFPFDIKAPKQARGKGKVHGS